ncbi:hypothetical protein ACJX0J_040984, partial [Zea mays]
MGNELGTKLRSIRTNKNLYAHTQEIYGSEPEILDMLEEKILLNIKTLFWSAQKFFMHNNITLLSNDEGVSLSGHDEMAANLECLIEPFIREEIDNFTHFLDFEKTFDMLEQHFLGSCSCVKGVSHHNMTCFALGILHSFTTSIGLKCLFGRPITVLERLLTGIAMPTAGDDISFAIWGQVNLLENTYILQAKEGNRILK